MKLVMEIVSSENRMNILLVSSSYDFYGYTKRILCGQADLYWCDFEQLDRETGKKIDVIIIDFDQKMVQDKSFRVIIEIKGKLNDSIPILALMEGETVQDIFEVLALGALDYLDKSNVQFEYEKKIASMIRWRWYYKQKGI